MSERYAGPERRKSDRTPAPPREVIGQARIRSAYREYVPGLEPGRWYDVIEQPADVLSPPLEGYVWLDDGTRPRHVWTAFLEIVGERPMPPRAGGEVE